MIVPETTDRLVFNCMKMVTKCVCGWCQTLIRDGITPVSHGMCPSCSEKLLAQLDNK
jgi:hypothetical protein